MTTGANDSWRYLTISPADREWGMVCTTVGYQNVAPRSPYPVSRHPTDYNPILSGRVLDEYQLIYITSGSGFFRSASFPTTKVSAGTIIMLFPGEWHTYGPDKKTGWSELWVGFKGEAADRITSRGFFTRKEPLLKIGISDTISGLYGELTSHAEKQKSGYQQLMAGVVEHILGLVHYKRQNIATENNPTIEKINRARMLMRENIGNPLSPEQIASELGLGYTWFRRVFREYMGISPAQYQIQLRMAKAKELLVSSGLPVSEIAYELGFESISQFSTFFKKRTGTTPTEFRGGNAPTYR